MELFVDVQGFMVPDFTVKELAVLSRDGKFCQHFIFKPPFPEDNLPDHVIRQVNWLYEYHHHLHWTEGYADYKDMERILRNMLRKAVKVYVKGDLKQKFLIPYFNGPIEDLLQLPSMRKYPLQKYCFYHSSPAVCSLNNVHVLKRLMDDRELREMQEKILCLNIMK